MSDPALLTLLQQRIKWASKRQGLIAQNIANVDTPNYQARDLKPMDFHSVLKATQSKGALTMTAGNHLKPKNAEGDFLNYKVNGGETSLSRNGVDLEDETLKMADTKDMHSAAIGMYKKYTDMIRLAIGRPTGQ